MKAGFPGIEVWSLAIVLQGAHDLIVFRIDTQPLDSDERTFWSRGKRLREPTARCPWTSP